MRKEIKNILICISFLCLGLVGCTDKQISRMNFFSPGMPTCESLPEEPVEAEVNQIESIKTFVSVMITDILVKDVGTIFLATITISVLLIASYVIVRCMRSLFGCIIVFLFQFGVLSINLHTLITNTIACDIAYILLGALIIDVALAFIIGTIYWLIRLLAFLIRKSFGD